MKNRIDLNLLVSDSRVQVLFLILFSAAILFTRLGQNGMANFDDGYYSEKGKEILKTGHWIVQTYDYHISLTNAPLFQDMQAVSYKLFGVDVFGAKFPSALFGFLNILLIYFVGRKLFDPWTGFFAASILATSYPFLKYSRHAMQDVTETFFIALAMVFLLAAVRKDRCYFWLWGLTVGFAIAVKSLMGFFPAVMAVVFLAVTRRWKTLLDPHFIGGCFLLLMTAGWVWPMYWANPTQFMNEHIGYLIMGKVQGGMVQAWYQHFGFFHDLLLYYWPWLPLLVYGFYLLGKGDFKQKETTTFVLVWAIVPWFIISATKCSFLWYYMQIFPPLALITAYGLLKLLNEKNKVQFAKIFMALGFVTAIALVVFPIRLDSDREKDTRIMAPYIKHFGDQGAQILALREGYFGLNNDLLFFSGHAAEPIFDRVEGLAKAFDSKNLVLCIVHQRDMPEIKSTLREWYALKYGGDFILIANQKVDVSAIQEW